MFVNLIILITLMGAGVHATTPSSKLPNVQHVIYMPTYGNQVTPWSTHQTAVNSSHSANHGIPLHQQPIGGVVESNKDQPAIQGRTFVEDRVNDVQQPQSTPANEGKIVHHPGNFMPTFYEDQVTILPQLDARDSDEELEVWPPVGIYPPPRPPPQAIKPTYYPAHYPIQYPGIKPTVRPTTKRPTTTRPTTKRPTTVRPRPPQYPPFYPKPPLYPHYPLEELPHFPHYPTSIATTTPRPKPGGADVEVLENYQILSDTGIREYKLRLSNGLTDFKKITKKHIGNKTIYVQTGYYSVPVDAAKNKYNLIHYIADERGYRIRGVQMCSNENPCKVSKE